MARSFVIGLVVAAAGSGCCSTTVDPPEIEFPLAWKLPLHVLVEMPPGFRDFRCFINNNVASTEIKIGSALTACTERLAGALFQKVAYRDQSTAGSEPEVDAVLSVAPGLLTQTGSEFFALSAV